MLWWPLMGRGLTAIVFGVLTMFVPRLTLGGLILLFAGYALIEGAVNIAGAIRSWRTREKPGVLLLQGIVSVAAGVAALIWPGITALALVMVIAAWAIGTGVLDIATAIRLRKLIPREWLLALAGIASVALGVLLFMYPGAGALAVVLWIGAYALAVGILRVILAIRLRMLAEPPAATPFHEEQPAH